MATNYPGSLDTGTEQPSPLSTTEMDDAGFEHDVVHTNHSEAIIALETKVGTGSSSAVADSVLAGTGAGASGWSTAPSLSAVTIGGESITPYTGRKNAVINGDMRVSQRGTTFNSVATGSYTLDRWVMDHAGGSTTVNITQEAFSLGQTDVVGATNYLRMNVVTSGDYAYLDHRIEDVTLFDNRTVTLSFWAKANSSMNLGFEWLQYFGSGGSTPVNGSNLGFSLTTSWQKFTYTINLPSQSGKTITSTSSFRLRFVPTSTDAIYASRWGANGNFTGTVDVALVQVESGDKATPFEHRSFGEELALCQRYYEQGNAWKRHQINDTVRTYYEDVQYKATKRAAPTVTSSYSNSQNVGYACSLLSSGSDSGIFVWNSSSSYDFQANLSWTASAEL